MSRPERADRNIRSVARALWIDGRGWILIMVSLGWFMAVGVRITYPALLPQMMEEYRLDYTMAGFVLSTLWVAYSIMQFPGGVFADIIGEQRIILISSAIAGASVIAVVFAPTFLFFVIGTALIGVGTGLYGTTRITLLSNIYPDADSTAIGLSQAAGNFGNMILPVGAGIISSYFGWRAGLGYLVPIFCVVIVGIWLIVPRRTSKRFAEGERIGRQFTSQLAKAVAVERVLLATAMLCCLLFLFQGVTGFLPTYLIDMKAFSTVAAATLFGFFFLSAIVIQFVSGVIADLYGPRLTIVIFTLLSTPAYLLFPQADGVASIVLIVFALAIAFGAIPPAHTYTVRLLPEAIQGSGYGLIRTGYMFVGATSPPLIGYLADTGQFDFAFPMLGIVVVGAGALSLLLLLRD